MKHDGRVISGVKDIDVLFWFRQNEAVAIPNRKHANKSIEWNLAHLGWRRLDFMKAISNELIDPSNDRDPSGIVHRYLNQTNHGRDYLAKKSVIGLYPDSIFRQPQWVTRRLLATASAPPGFVAL